jgi:hypothetical protein
MLQAATATGTCTVQQLQQQGLPNGNHGYDFNKPEIFLPILFSTFFTKLLL